MLREMARVGDEYRKILANANFHFAQEATLNNILEVSLSETYAPKQIRDKFAAVRPLCVWGGDSEKRVK